MAGRVKLTEMEEGFIRNCCLTCDACLHLERAYGANWDAEQITSARRLEQIGFMVFVDCYRMPHNGAFIRRSTATSAGLAAIGASGVLGMLPPAGRALLASDARKGE